MKRLTLVLAAAATVLGTGCGPAPSRCTYSATVDWTGGFLGSDNVVRPRCSDAGVTWVDLFINGDASTAVRVACTAGAMQAVDLPSGANVLTIEGIEGSGRIAYRAEVTVAPTCRDQAISVTPAEGTLAVDYSFSPDNVCYAPPSYIWTKVFDVVANDVAFEDKRQAADTQCSTTAAAPTYRLPAGSFRLLGVNEWAPGVGYVGADCSQPSFTIAGGATTDVRPVLVDSSRNCF